MITEERLLVSLTDGRVLQFILEAECPGCEKIFGDCICPLLNPLTLDELVTCGFAREIEWDDVTDDDTFIGEA